jgi:superfamily II DNA or RNA helicase
MKPINEKIYLPPRVKLAGYVAENSITQLAYAGQLEDIQYEAYDRRGVKGWIFYRSNGEKLLVAPTKTTANPYGYVLVMPNSLERFPSSKKEITTGTRWLFPKAIRFKGPDDKLIAACDTARNTWTDSFRFVEEKRSGDLIVQSGLRNPQLGAIYASLAHWKVTDEVGTIVMPTGTGKTETMLALLAKIQPKCLLVIVPTSALRDQISQKFLTFGILQEFGIVAESANLPVVGKIEHKFETTDDAKLFLQSCNVAVTTMAVLGQCNDDLQNTLAANCSHLFIDEAHHVPATTWNNFRELVQSYKKPILQFTATPFRRDGKHVGGKSIFTYPLKKAQDDEYFTPITFVSIWEYNRSNSDHSIAKRALQALLNDLATDHDHILMARTDTIERATRVHEIYCDLVSYMLLESSSQYLSQLNPLIVHSNLAVNEQMNAIEAIHTRQSRVIVCVDMLGEGFDLPQLKIAALHDIHKSLAVTIQFIGRFTRTASGLGSATVIANAADADVEEALEDLYSKDADWNVVLRHLSEGATGLQEKRSRFIEGFQNIPEGVHIQNIYPKMSMVAYKTYCKAWRPSSVEDLLTNLDLLVRPTVNQKDKVLFFITREKIPVTWGEARSIHDLVHHLYLIHWDDKQNLLFINSTNNKSVHLDIAKKIAGDNVEIIKGEIVYRALFDVNRLIISNLGLLHLISRANQFTMHVGSDVKEGLDRASIGNRNKTNLFSRGYENEAHVTIGASHKGRIWSHKIAEDISEWVEWCQHIGKKLLNDSISTEDILKGAIIPQKIQERPSLVPLNIEWPIDFLRRSEEAVVIEIDEVSAPFYDTNLEITTYSDSGPIQFSIMLDDKYAIYEAVFKKESIDYVPAGGSIVYVSVGNNRKSLTDWFFEEPPIITFEDTSKIENNEYLAITSEREPYDASEILVLDWSEVDLTAESQYKACKEPKRLELREQSIQRFVIKDLLNSEEFDYDVIFDDDGSGEIADIVALKVNGDDLFVHFFHCKYSKADDSGVRVGDLYEVCGQAQKSVYWRGQHQKLFERLKFRELSRQESYGVSRFEKGDLEKLDELRRQARVLYPKFHIYIVQPGLQCSSINEAVLDLLGATELYLQKTFAVPFTVIANS